MRGDDKDPAEIHEPFGDPMPRPRRSQSQEGR
jgi:hypothetical protein